VLNWGDSWHHRVPDYSRIPKMPVINPQKSLILSTALKTFLHGLSITNLNFSEFTLLVEIFAQKEL
jgi:hypothetical protein